jgi:hypothetical protein
MGYTPNHGQDRTQVKQDFIGHCSTPYAPSLPLVHNQYGLHSLIAPNSLELSGAKISIPLKAQITMGILPSQSAPPMSRPL